MFKNRVALVALLAALLSIFATSAANAAYSPPPFTADVPSDVDPGEQFTLTFSSGNINCSWHLKTFHGQKVPDGSGTSFTVTLIAPKGNGNYTVTALCTWDPETVNSAAPASTSNTVTPAVLSTSAASSSDTLRADPQTESYSVQLPVGDVGDAADTDNGVLPNTGGSNLLLLAGGAGLVVIGAGVTIAARRRKAA